MSTSGTYTYNPSLGEMVLYSYQLIGVRPTAVLQEHMDAARRQLERNGVTNDGNGWKVEA